MSSIIPLSNTPASMSSREIAELTEKQHAHVCRDIRAMLDKIYDNPDDPIMDHKAKQGVTEERDARGYVSLYRMDKEHTITLLLGYDAKARFRVVKRWQELEGQQSASPYAALSSHTVRAVQIGYSKSVNTALIDHGGRNAIVSYNLKNCTVQSGRLPLEWKALGKQEGLPSKSRNSAKDVLRVKAPQVACGMSLADQLVSGGAKPDDGISIGKDSQSLFKRILALGITPPELLL